MLERERHPEPQLAKPQLGAVVILLGYGCEPALGEYCEVVHSQRTRPV